MADYKVTDAQLISVANAIRAKTGKSEQIEFPTEFVSEIGSISGGGDADEWTSLKDYIESSGTQYIDTGYSGKSNSRYELIANFKIQNSYPIILRVTGGLVNINWNGAAGRIYYGSNYEGISFIKHADKLTKVVVKNKYYGIESEDGTMTNSPTSYDFASGSETAFLFWNEGAATNYAYMKFYRLRIYEDDTLVHEFVPWTDENDVVCIKDTVTGDLKYNGGTGVFTRGTDT